MPHGETGPDIAQRIRQSQGTLISQTRLRRGLSPNELTAAINALDIQGLTVTVGAVSHWENGIASPRPVTQLAIAKVLNVAWSTLFSLDGYAL